MKKGMQISDKKSFTTNKKNKDSRLLNKVLKQERLSLEIRHEHSVSVQGMNIQFHAWFYIRKSLPPHYIWTSVKITKSRLNNKWISFW